MDDLSSGSVYDELLEMCQGPLQMPQLTKPIQHWPWANHVWQEETDQWTNELKFHLQPEASHHAGQTSQDSVLRSSGFSVLWPWAVLYLGGAACASVFLPPGKGIRHFPLCLITTAFMRPPASGFPSTGYNNQDQGKVKWENTSLGWEFRRHGMRQRIRSDWKFYAETWGPSFTDLMGSKDLAVGLQPSPSILTFIVSGPVLPSSSLLYLCGRAWQPSFLCLLFPTSCKATADTLLPTCLTLTVQISLGTNMSSLAKFRQNSAFPPNWTEVSLTTFM